MNTQKHMRTIYHVCIYIGTVLLLLACSTITPSDKNTDNNNGNTGDDSKQVTYKATFRATWSKETHPTNFPANAHFSPLVGMTHSSATKLFTVDEKATAGIENMAETGKAPYLNQEIDTRKKAGTAGERINGGGIGRSPGSVSVQFTITKKHPLVSLVSMIAPSHDWFIAVRDFRLWENNQWKQTETVIVKAYDAGTESGDNFSLKPDTNENKVIHRITTGPLAKDGVVPSMGTITFERINN